MTFFRRLWHLLNRRRYEQELVLEMREHRDAMHDAMQDLTVGVRTLMKAPSFAIVGMVLRSEPFYLEHTDPVAFALALSVFAGAGAIAALWPAIAVLKRNPVDALRHA